MKKVLLVLVLLCVVAWTAFKTGVQVANTMSHKTELRPINIESVQSKLSQVSELATVSYSYTDVAKHSKSENIWGMKIPFSTSTLIMQYSGVIKAGINLANAKFDVSDTIVTFYLPKTQILSHEIDPNSLRILNQSNGLFSSIKLSDFNKFCIEHKDTMEVRALESGLLGEAQDKASESLSLIIDPLTADGYTVYVRSLNDSIASVLENKAKALQ